MLPTPCLHSLNTAANSLASTQLLWIKDLPRHERKEHSGTEQQARGLCGQPQIGVVKDERKEDMKKREEGLEVTRARPRAALISPEGTETLVQRKY